MLSKALPWCEALRDFIQVILPFLINQPLPSPLLASKWNGEKRENIRKVFVGNKLARLAGPRLTVSTRSLRVKTHPSFPKDSSRFITLRYIYRRISSRQNRQYRNIASSGRCSFLFQGNKNSYCWNFFTFPVTYISIDQYLYKTRNKTASVLI